jgi:hypothetical protein
MAGPSHAPSGNKRISGRQLEVRLAWLAIDLKSHMEPGYREVMVDRLAAILSVFPHFDVEEFRRYIDRNSR